MVGNPPNSTAAPIIISSISWGQTDYCGMGVLPSAAVEQGHGWPGRHLHSALSTVGKRRFSTNRTGGVSHHHTCFRKNASSSSETSSSKKLSSSVSGTGTVARAALSLLLREKPFQKAWKVPPPPQKKKTSYSRKPSMNHRAKVNTVHHPIREINHVHLSFNCSVLCSLNSA